MNNGMIPADSMPRFTESTNLGVVCSECNKAFIAYGTPPGTILADCPWCDSDMSKKVGRVIDQEGYIPKLGLIKKAFKEVDRDLHRE